MIEKYHQRIDVRSICVCNATLDDKFQSFLQPLVQFVERHSDHTVKANLAIAHVLYSVTQGGMKTSLQRCLASFCACLSGPAGEVSFLCSFIAEFSRYLTRRRLV